MSQSITIKTVTAPAVTDSYETLTPRLRLEVEYTLGGTSFFTGSHFPRGYEISVKHDRVSDRGFTSMLIDGKGNPTAPIEPAKRFSAKTLERIVNEVRSGKHDELIAKLYAKAVSNRSEYAWPESILPLVDRVAHLRNQLRNESISYDELHELQAMADKLDPTDVELLEAAGVPESR